MAATSDRIIHTAAIGSRGDAPMTLDSVGRIASMTKALVSLLALRLVAQGKLALDAPIATLVPELAAPSILTGFDDGGNPRLIPATTPITLRHLLTHSAGLGYDTWNPDLKQYCIREGMGRIPANAGELSRTPLIFEPGTRWNYGINIEVAGLVIERAAGKTLAEVLADEITGPLGMVDTAWLPGPSQTERLIELGKRGPDNKIAPMPAPIPTELPFIYGGGGLFCTAPDYITFLQAVMRGDLLPPALHAEYLRPQLPASPNVGQLKSCDPRSNDADLFGGMPATWSLGFLMNTQPTAQGRTAFSHCWAGINNSYYWMDLKRGTCGVLIAQLMPFADPGVISTFEAYERAINGL
jgi:CubicO group peptidase (beta-lactamase class C family)